MNVSKAEKLTKIILIFAIACCCVLLLPQVRGFIIENGEKIIGRKVNYDNIMKKLLTDTLSVIFFLGIILLCLTKRAQVFLEKQIFVEKYGRKIFTYVSVVAVVISFVVIIGMYIKCRSLWADESTIASNIIVRNWVELLTPPLDYNQSAPVLYVIAVKSICSIFGHSEFSVRIFSFFSYIGLLICEVMFLKGAFGCNNYRVGFVVAASALLPCYIWYSNELKPYMGDAFFVILTLLLYFYYTKDKIKLPTLAILYIIILGFSTPSIFFIGGIFIFEFIADIINKNKKQIVYVSLSGLVILAVFGLYYHWWLSSVMDTMDIFWNKPVHILKKIKDLLFIFSPGVTNSDSSIVMLFVPFALLGIFSLGRSKNKIACSTALSLLFVFVASAIGKWPMTGRLWLFLPAVVLIFTPIGFDFVHGIIKRRRITDKIEIGIFSAIVIYLTVGCFGYMGGKMYLSCQEVNPLIYYVRENIKEDEKLYVYPPAVHTVQFKNGYNTARIGNVANDNIIYGKNKNEWRENSEGNELQLILENNKSYLIFQNHWGAGIDSGLDVLRTYGALTEVMNVYDTPLYYFEKYTNNE